MHHPRGVTLMVAVIVMSASLAAQTIQINRENKTIAISTTDESIATADIAAVTVGFDLYGPDAKATYAQGGQISQAVLEALRKAGLPDKDIESSGQGVQRNTDFDEKAPPADRVQKQWIFSQSWTVSVSPSAAAEVIRVAVAAGANKTGAIDWRLADRKTLQARAAEAALVKAQAVAAHMADGLRVKLGELIYASNETPNTRVFFARTSQGMLNTNSASVASRIAVPKLELRPQTIREEATVYAVFAIE